MGKTIIKIKCVDQRLIVASAPLIAAGGQNEDVVQFDFCPLWEGFGKTAVFYRTEDEVYNVVLAEDECAIPNEVLAQEGVLFFGVYGVNGGTKRTTEIIKYNLVKGALIPGKEPAEPTPDIYAQILQKYGDLESRVGRLEAGGGSGGGSGGAGVPGEDGGYYTPVVLYDGTLTWTPSKADMPAALSTNIKGPQGAAGVPGVDGEPGVGIAKITVRDSSVTGGANRVTIELTDGTSTSFNVQNGRDGARGATGPAGADGAPGATGPAGYTPVKGTDYWTADDRQQMVSDVLAALPAAEGASF